MVYWDTSLIARIIEGLRELISIEKGTRERTRMIDVDFVSILISQRRSERKSFLMKTMEAHGNKK